MHCKVVRILPNYFKHQRKKINAQKLIFVTKIKQLGTQKKFHLNNSFLSKVVFFTPPIAIIVLNNPPILAPSSKLINKQIN